MVIVYNCRFIFIGTGFKVDVNLSKPNKFDAGDVSEILQDTVKSGPFIRQVVLESARTLINTSIKSAVLMMNSKRISAQHKQFNVLNQLDIGDRAANGFPKTVEIIYYKAGSGHLSTALALKDSIEQSEPGCNVILTDVYLGLKGASVYEQHLGQTADKIYNHMFSKNKLKDNMTFHRHLMQKDENIMGEVWCQHFAMQFAANKPEAVISVIPAYNKTLSNALERYNPKIPFVYVVTDYSLPDNVFPAFDVKPNQYAVCPTPETVKHCVSSGYGENKILQTGGLIVHPKLYGSMQLDVIQEKQKLGLEPDLPTGIIMFGGIGTGDMPAIAKQLERVKTKTQYIFICGSNTKAQSQLTKLQTNYPKAVFGFTDQVSKLMQLSDFFIGKAGGLSITEAMMKKLPMLVQSDADASPLEALNVQWLTKNGYGTAIHDMAHIDQDVELLLKPDTFKKYQAQVSSFSNQAVFDTVNLISYLHKESKKLSVQSPASTEQKKIKQD